MSHFIKIISSEEKGNVEFFFDRIASEKELRYHLTVVTNKKEIFHFTMRKDGSKWKIVEAPKPPEWIIKLQEKLSEALNGHLSSYNT